MRRRRLWILGAIAALTVLVVAIVLSRRPPFDFLAGHQPLPPAPWEQELDRLNGSESVYYSFKTDNQSFLRKATAELLSQGYQVMPDLGMDWGREYDLVFARGDVAALNRGISLFRVKIPDVEIVQLKTASRRWSGGDLWEPHWATVAISWRRPQSTIERLRRWFRL